MTTTATERPLPIVTEENARYWRSARAHRLELPFCMACERAFYPPQHRCPTCLSDRVEWRPVSGRGRVFTWIVMHQVYDPWFKDKVPYVVAAVELEEGPRLITNLVNCPHDRIRLNMPVRVVYEDVNDELALVYFEPEERA
jgi:uncharacterized OB-fold protein